MATAAKRGRLTPTAEPSAPRHIRLLHSLEAELRRRDPDGAGLDGVDDLDALARQLADTALESTSRWLDHLGPFYDAHGVAQLLGRDGRPVTRQAVSKRKGLLALTTGSGQVVYPAFQFRDRALAPGLAEVLAELPEDVVSRWTVASWLACPERELDDERPIDVLHEGTPGAVSAVVRAAHSWAGDLAQ